MGVTSIDTVFVWVTDLDRAVDWYRTLGIQPGARYGGWQTMEMGGETSFGLHAGTPDRRDPTAVVAFGAEDLSGEIGRLAATGIRPIDDITDTGVARFVTFADPDGNHIQLLERR